MLDISGRPLPSVDVLCPAEEGGPIARTGFDYQDEIAVGFMLDMLGDSSLLAVHCETHDDILLVFAADTPARVAEYVQVKATSEDKLWTVPDLCRRKKKDTASSIFEKSLAHDRCLETSRFRIVTLRPVATELRCLTFSIGSNGREPEGDPINALVKKLDNRFPEAKSIKGNGPRYWVENCCWDEGESQEAVHNANQVKLMGQSVSDSHQVLPEFADVLLEELASIAREAGTAKWVPDRDKKKITREWLRAWWERRLLELADGAGIISGGKLRGKLRDANLEELADLASELRREYAAELRTSSYMPDDHRSRLQRRVNAEMLSLRSELMAGTIDVDGPGFHKLCLDRLDSIETDFGDGSVDLSAFLRGCMYDISDRCLLRFARPI